MIEGSGSGSRRPKNIRSGSATLSLRPLWLGPTCGTSPLVSSLAEPELKPEIPVLCLESLVAVPQPAQLIVLHSTA